MIVKWSHAYTKIKKKKNIYKKAPKQKQHARHCKRLHQMAKKYCPLLGVTCRLVYFSFSQQVPQKNVHSFRAFYEFSELGFKKFAVLFYAIALIAMYF